MSVLPEWKPGQLIQLCANVTTSTQQVTTMEDPPIPRGYEIINDIIDLRGSELMNTDALARNVLTAGANGALVESGTDSQLLAFAPLQNKCSLQSILIHTPDDIDGTSKQLPARAKVWPNLVTPLSFDEASNQAAPSEGRIGERSASGWHEIALKYVKFQNISSVLLLLDGEEDEDDVPIVFDRLVFVGRKFGAFNAGSVKSEAGPGEM